MKICAAIPVGPIDRMGYQYLTKYLISNNALLFDKLYLYSSTREITANDFKLKNVEVISDARTWDILSEDGSECFDMRVNREKRRSASAYVIRKAATDGFDVLMNLSVNQYIDEYNYKNLVDYSRKIISKNKPFGYLWKSYQYRDLICYADKKLPWLINLKYSKNLSFVPDGILYNELEYSIRDGFFIYPKYTIYDLDGMLTNEDSCLKWEYYEKYLSNNLVPYNATAKKEYVLNKIRKKIFAHKYVHADTMDSILNAYKTGSQYYQYDIPNELKKNNLRKILMYIISCKIRIW